jgi:hypothetical protein
MRYRTKNGVKEIHFVAGKLNPTQYKGRLKSFASSAIFFIRVKKTG